MSLELLILGSNSAAFAHRRHHTAQLFKLQDQQFLIDCGEGTQLLMKRNKVKLSRIDHIFISHLHGDHYFGLIGLLSTMHLFGRKKELILIGPPGLKEIIQLQLRHSETALNFPIDFTEFKPGETSIVLDHPKYNVTALPMDHRVPCSGYLFKEKPKKRRINRKMLPEVKLSNLDIVRLKDGEDILNEDGSVKYENKLLTMDPNPSFSYAFFSDTKLRPELQKMIEGVDMLYHEATFANDMKDRAEQTYHTTAEQAAQYAKEANVGKLILGHFSARYKELDPIINEAKAVFPNTELAIEGTKFVVDGK
ncbi:RNAse Z [Ekhidna lutea]|uniref:Ribonuclease Z n=1 Tax=Ekhidna lutea TaxID=447679 RepID=A0A239K398_EKHLU|nr:ribonuclease Z [Ekhidna lutea]SNT11604.1 RNAse Z [Ekhidna lutea]